MNCFELLTDLPQNNENFNSDMDKRYRQTHILVKDSKSKEFIVAYVRSMMDTYIYDFRINGKVVNVDIRNPPYIEAKPFLPETGYYTYNGSQAIYIYKNPQRQWKRSFCNSIYSVNSPANFLANYGRMDDTTMQVMAKQIHEPVYYTMDSFPKEMKSFAINIAFACVKDYEDIWHLVYRRIPIGKIDFKEKLITDIPEIMKQEVMDMLVRNNLQLWTMK